MNVCSGNFYHYDWLHQKFHPIREPKTSVKFAGNFLLIRAESVISPEDVCRLLKCAGNQATQDDLPAAVGVHVAVADDLHLRNCGKVLFKHFKRSPSGLLIHLWPLFYFQLRHQADNALGID